MKNILITGGGFHNKGAQAMTFIAVSELAERFPEHRLIVISNKDVALMEQEDYPYNFTIMSTALCIPNGYYLLGGLWKLLAIRRGVTKQDAMASKKIWENTDYVIDISGYALGSNWGNATSMLTALWAELAKKFHAKIIYMPQSFGPFEYEGLKGKLVKHCVSKYMKKADLVCAREEVGRLLLQNELQLQNVIQSPDLVLQNKEIHVEAIYKQIPRLLELEVEAKSIGIIPNTETFRYIEKQKVLSMYEMLIGKLLKQGYTVYVLAHAKNDIALCSEIKDLYKDNPKVIEVTDTLSCLEFDRNVSKFEFLIASRYHSVIHAYRNSVPCIVIGWADKYKELTKLCGQEEFAFDVRSEEDIQSVSKGMDCMMGRVQDCKNRIRCNVDKIRLNNIFDKLEQV